VGRLGNTASDDYRSIWSSFATDLSGTPRIKTTRNARIRKKWGKVSAGERRILADTTQISETTARKRETEKKEKLLNFQTASLYDLV
jgi:hypothetical protein